MRLYHFTAFHHVDGGLGHAGPGIARFGLLPNSHPLIALPPLVWMTADDSWDQFWSPRPVPGIGCDRTEARLTVVVPRSNLERLLPMDRVLPFVDVGWRDDFIGGFDLSPWRAFMGHVPSSWVRAVDGRPVPVAA